MKILIIEDNATLANLLSAGLKKNGFDCYCVGDGEEGEKHIKLNRQNNYDLILLDLTLPGKQGFELYQIIKRETSIPVIIITALSDKKAQDGLNSIADCPRFIKPFLFKDLLSEIKSIARNKAVSAS